MNSSQKSLPIIIRCNFIAIISKFNMGAIVQLLFLFLLSLCALETKGEAELYPPQVEVQTFVYNEEESNFTVVDTKYYNNNRRNVIATPGMYIEITCYASYPIAWKTDGYVGQVPIEVLEVRREVGDVAEESSRFSSRIRVLLDLSSTGYYSCFRVGDDTLTAPIYVFVKNDKIPLINSGQEIVVRGRVIPCRTSNPEILVSLLRPMSEEDNKYERVTAGYDPKVGFDLGEKYVYGNYLCITPFDKIRAEVIRDDVKSTFSVFPDKPKVLLLENDLLNLTCTSENDDIELEYLGNKTDGVKLEANDRSKIFLYRGSAGEAGSVTCFTKNSSHTWSFRFIETPRFEFNQRTGAALCHTDVTDRYIYSLGCSNPAQCNLLRNCLEDIRGNCAEVVYKGKKCRPQKCAVLENTHFNGILQCQVEDLRISREYFTGLDGQRYFDLKNAPQESIIQINAANVTVTENEPAYFFCEANSFLLTQQLKFAIKYANGSVATLAEDQIQEDTSNRTVTTKRGTISRGVFMNLTSDAHDVLCLAALWNSTEWFNASTPVIVKSVSSPLAEGETAATFLIGETGRNLFCYGAGHPQPTLRWVKDGETLGSEYVFSETKDGSLILHFPEITEDHQGDYVCLAKNYLGKDKLIVNVEVLDRNQTCTSVSFVE